MAAEVFVANFVGLFGFAEVNDGGVVDIELVAFEF